MIFSLRCLYWMVWWLEYKLVLWWVLLEICLEFFKHLFYFDYILFAKMLLFSSFECLNNIIISIFILSIFSSNFNGIFTPKLVVSLNHFTCDYFLNLVVAINFFIIPWSIAIVVCYFFLNGWVWIFFRLFCFEIYLTCGGSR